MTLPYLHVFPTQHREQVLTFVAATADPTDSSIVARMRQGNVNQISRSHLGWLLGGVHEPNRVFADVIIHQYAPA